MLQYATLLILVRNRNVHPREHLGMIDHLQILPHQAAHAGVSASPRLSELLCSPVQHEVQLVVELYWRESRWCGQDVLSVTAAKFFLVGDVVTL